MYSSTSLSISISQVTLCTLTFHCWSSVVFYPEIFSVRHAFDNWRGNRLSSTFYIRETPKKCFFFSFIDKKRIPSRNEPKKRSTHTPSYENSPVTQSADKISTHVWGGHNKITQMLSTVFVHMCNRKVRRKNTV